MSPQPRRDPQLRVAVAGGDVDVVDAVLEQDLERPVRVALGGARQCAARSMSACSRSGSYHVAAVAARPSQRRHDRLLMVCSATPRSVHTRASVSNVEAYRASCIWTKL